MLVLKRRVGQGIWINAGDPQNLVRLLVTEIKGGTVKLGFDAPARIEIERDDCIHKPRDADNE